MCLPPPFVEPSDTPDSVDLSPKP